MWSKRLLRRSCGRVGGSCNFWRSAALFHAVHRWLLTVVDALSSFKIDKQDYARTVPGHAGYRQFHGLYRQQLKVKFLPHCIDDLEAAPDAL